MINEIFLISFYANIWKMYFHKLYFRYRQSCDMDKIKNSTVLVCAKKQNLHFFVPYMALSDDIYA